MTFDLDTGCSFSVLVIAYHSAQWLHLVKRSMNPHHRENFNSPNLYHRRHHVQRHTVKVLEQRVQVDCSETCGTLQAGSNVGWED
jgi:hypothetical protein